MCRCFTAHEWTSDNKCVRYRYNITQIKRLQSKLNKISGSVFICLVKLDEVARVSGQDGEVFPDTSHWDLREDIGHAGETVSLIWPGISSKQVCVRTKMNMICIFPLVRSVLLSCSKNPQTTRVETRHCWWSPAATINILVCTQAGWSWNVKGIQQGTSSSFCHVRKHFNDVVSALGASPDHYEHFWPMW